MTEAPRISVVIPTYNRVTMLQNAIESVLSQEEQSVEILVFDNASTDETAQYLGELSQNHKNIKVFRNETNIGPVANYQRGLGEIRTPYFVPLADDDWLLPGFLNEALPIMEGDSTLGAAIYVTEGLDEAHNLVTTYPDCLDRRRFGKLTPRQHMHDWLRYGHHGWSSILWRSEVLAFIKPPYLHVGLPSDVDFQAQIFCHFPVHLENKIAAVYLMHKEQGSRSMNIAELRSFSDIFRHIDREVIKNELFDLDEYLNLRHISVMRYCGIWRTSTNALSDDQLRLAATTAGLVLNDWESAASFARDLAARGTSSPQQDDATETGPSPAGGLSNLYFLPPLPGEQTSSAPVRTRNDLTVSAILWADEARRRHADLDRRNLDLTQSESRLTAEKAELEREVAAKTDEVAELAREVTTKTDAMAELAREISTKTHEISELQAQLDEAHERLASRWYAIRKPLHALLDAIRNRIEKGTRD